MHNASVAEVYYDAIYCASERGAEIVLDTLTSYSVIFVETISKELIKWIGYFKTRYKISFADSFVLATAKVNNAGVLTSDHHEFDEVEKNREVLFDWIR